MTDASVGTQGQSGWSVAISLEADLLFDLVTCSRYRDRGDLRQIDRVESRGDRGETSGASGESHSLRYLPADASNARRTRTLRPWRTRLEQAAYVGEQAVVHQLMLDRGAQAFFNGHDHVFTHMVVAGIHYALPGGAGPAWTFSSETTGYADYWPQSGHVCVDVDPEGANVQFLGVGGEVFYSFTIESRLRPASSRASGRAVQAPGSFRRLVRSSSRGSGSGAGSTRPLNHWRCLRTSHWSSFGQGRIERPPAL